MHCSSTKLAAAPSIIGVSSTPLMLIAASSAAMPLKLEVSSKVSLALLGAAVGALGPSDGRRGGSGANGDGERKRGERGDVGGADGGDDGSGDHGLGGGGGDGSGELGKGGGGGDGSGS